MKKLLSAITGLTLLFLLSTPSPVANAGYINSGGSGPNCVTGTPGVYQTDGTSCTFSAAAGAGDFTGPGSSTTHNLVGFADTTGKIGEDSGLLTSTVITTTNTKTLTNKTLTAPVISTITNTGTVTLFTASDTVVGRATTDTLTNKTLTAPVIASIVNTGTLTLPTSSDTLVGRATTDTLTNKTLTAPVIATFVAGGNTITAPGAATTLVGRDTTDTLTNKTLTLPVIASVSNGGTVTIPSGADTLVARTSTDTLTNKTLTSPTISGASTSIAKGNCRVDPLEVDIGNTGTAQSIDLSTGNVFTGTLTGNLTVTFSNGTAGCPYVFVWTQDGTGSRTLTHAGITTIWGNTGAKTLTTTASAIDKVTCIYNGTLSKLMCDLGTVYQ